MDFAFAHKGLPRSWARAPLLFSLMKKVTKKSSHPGGFSAALALCAANQVKPKARSFCRRLSHKACASGNPDSYRDTNARATARPNLFYRLSPEAARLTVWVLTEI
jgi:hypothetical protein